RGRPADVPLPCRRHRCRRAHGCVEDRNCYAEQASTFRAQSDLIRPGGERLPMDAPLEAEAVEAFVTAHGERADDSTQREDLDDREPNSRRVAKPEHESRSAERLRASQREEGA